MKELIKKKLQGFKNYAIVKSPQLRNFALTVICTFALFAMLTTVSAMREQNQIASNVLRFHILANSNSTDDQALKLKVRDDVLTYVNTLTNSNFNLQQTKEVIGAHLNDIAQIAEQSVKNNGYNYKVIAKLGEFNLPTKQYGDIVLPPGEYAALRLEIGEANGHNWWCVMYPNICVSATNATLPIESKQLLQQNLTPQEYRLINGESPLKSRILEFLYR
ncbi:MAG: stage II sporulation protein R [Clostridiales bacterium]|jgi:stage II sporulation protein R|nr:stage II sporulation protein R [Clostridiales bacterium]